MYDLIYKQKGKDYYHKLWHTPEKNVFLFIHSGDGNIETRETSYSFAPGVLCFIGEKKYHYTFSNIPELYERSKLFIETDVLEPLVQTVSTSHDFRNMFSENALTMAVLSKDDMIRAEDLFDRLKSIPVDFNYKQEEILSAVIQLLLILAKNKSGKTAIASDTFQTAINFINQHISEDISIDRISTECYLNKHYLCRLFKRKLGITVMEYILQTRLAMAKELLTKEKISVTQVSMLCGFSSSSYFSRIFKERIGISPTVYRKKQNI